MATAPALWTNQGMSSENPRQRDASVHRYEESLLNSPQSELEGVLWEEHHRLTLTVHNRNHEFRRNFLAALERRRRVERSIQRSRLEMEWLRQHRAEYGGRWVALIGDTLLSAANTAREVYDAVRNLEERPVVVRVEAQDEPPFSGW